MTGWLCVVLAALGAPSTDALVAEGLRVPLSVVVLAPGNDAGRASISDILRLTSESMRRRTDFAPVFVEPSAVEDCRGRLSCMVRRVTANEPAVGYLLVISLLTSAGSRDRVFADVVDVRKARQIFEGEGAESEIEGRTNEEAVLARAKLTIEDPQGAQRQIEKALSILLEEAFSGSEHLDPFGSISLVGADPGLEIKIDRVSVGTTRRGTTEIIEVPAGKRALSIEHPDYPTSLLSVDVKRGEHLRVQVATERKSIHRYDTEETVLLWSGVALIALGTASVLYAGLRPESDVRSYCWSPRECTGDQFVSSSYAGVAAPSTGGSANGDGILLAPLGIGLAGSGVGLSTGALLGGDAIDPWLTVAASLAVGVATYATLTLANPAGAFD